MQIDTNLQALVRDLGLDEYELRLYASALELGGATASDLARRADIPRTSAYSALERLMEKGLIAAERRSGGNIFLPSNPEALVLHAEGEVARAQQSLKRAKQVAQILNSSGGQDAMTSSKILIVEGKAGVRNLLYAWEERWRDSVITSRRAWTGFQDESFLAHYGEWVTHYWQRFQHAKGTEWDRLELFAEIGPVGRTVAASVAGSAGARRALRPIPGLGFSATLWVVGEYLLLFKTRSSPHYALQIRDSSLAENVHAVFSNLWASTQPPKKG